MNKKNIILLGPPGSGKGTQGDLLAKKLGVPRLSIGALIRRYTREDTSDFGKTLHRYSYKGASIPGDLLMQILEKWIKENPRGFVIDNFIRTEDQLNSFKNSSLSKQLSIDAVFVLVVSKKTCLKRLAKRKKIQKRIDETSKATQKRFSTYYESIQSISAYFNSMGILIEIDAERSTAVIHNTIMKKLKGMV